MKIISIEGLNGAGKTTQAFLLGEKLKQSIDNPIYILCDPGITKEHEAFKKLKPLASYKAWRNPLTNMMVYMAARCELNAELERINKVEPNAIVILDRYILSFYVYGASAFRQAQTEPSSEILAYRDIATILKICNIRQPDLTIYLNVTPEIAMKRWMAVNGDTPDLYEQGGINALKEFQARYIYFINNSERYYGLGKIFPTPQLPDVSCPDEVLDTYFDEINSLIESKLGVADAT